MSASELQFAAVAQPAMDYSKIAQEDKPVLELWIKLKERINALPRSKTAERRKRAEEILSRETKQFEGFLKKYPPLLVEYFDLTQTLTQYINAQTKPLEEGASIYFKDLFHKKGQELSEVPEFFVKKGGDQLGRQMRLTYIDKDTKEKRTIEYYIKTHQGGAKSGQSSVKHVDPKELFVYKVLEYTGLGPKVHFFFNPLSPGGFYIATQDCGYSKSSEKQKTKSFMTIGTLKSKLECDPKEETELVNQMNDTIASGFACADISSRVFCLRDVITNSGNSGFVINKEKYKFKIIDFTVMDIHGGYSSDSICAGYLSGNGVFNYLDDVFLKKYLIDVTVSQKIESAQKVQTKLFIGNKLSLMDAIDKAAGEVAKFVNENHVNLGITQIQPDQNHDFNRYVKDVKFNYGKFLEDLNKNVLQLSDSAQRQMTEMSSVGSSNSHLLQFQHMIQRPQQQVDPSLKTANLETKQYIRSDIFSKAGVQ